MSRMGDLQRRSKELFSKEFFKGQKLTAEEAKEASEIACIFEIHAHLATAMLGPGKSTNFFGAFTNENHEEATVVSGGRDRKGNILYKIRYKKEAKKAQEEN